jgi:murein DD-endopeptidase MepM/ murein hydrolase activator NlpD
MQAGIDLIAPIGTNVNSINSGTVHETRSEDESNGYGNYIIIESNGYYFMYAHLKNKPAFNIGTNISSGQLIGLGGDSDTTGEPHLHIESRLKSGNF